MEGNLPPALRSQRTSLPHRTIEIGEILECEFLAGIKVPGISIQGTRLDGGTYEVVVPMQRVPQLITLLSREAGGKAAGRPRDI